MGWMGWKGKVQKTFPIYQQGHQLVTIQEVGLLAKQWGMGAEAAQFYVNQVLAIGNEKIDTDEVERLALMLYGNTGQSAKE